MRTHSKSFSIPRSFRGAIALTAACATGLAIATGAGCSRPSSTAPEPPGGGQSFVLDYTLFAAQVDTILTARGCDDLNCHGGGIRGTFELSPANDKNVAFDFTQVSLQVDGGDPAASPLLLKPLASGAGGAAHGGGSIFMSTGDADYQALLAWIQAGEYR